MLENGESLPVLGPGVPDEWCETLHSLDVVGKHVQARHHNLGQSNNLVPVLLETYFKTHLATQTRTEPMPCLIDTVLVTSEVR